MKESVKKEMDIPLQLLADQREPYDCKEKKRKISITGVEKQEKGPRAHPAS